MTFASDLYLEIGPFPMTKPLRGNHSLFIYTFTQADSDGGGTIATGIGTTAGNGEVIAAWGNGDVVSKPVNCDIAADTGIVTIEVDGTAGPTVGQVFMLVKKS